MSASHEKRLAAAEAEVAQRRNPIEGFDVSRLDIPDLKLLADLQEKARDGGRLQEMEWSRLSDEDIETLWKLRNKCIVAPLNSITTDLEACAREFDTFARQRSRGDETE